MAIEKMVTEKKINIRAVVKTSMFYFPRSKNMRRQWIRKTLFLIREDKHILYGSKIKWGAQALK